jgi:hypothetical protein
MLVPAGISHPADDLTTILYVLGIVALVIWIAFAIVRH